MDDDLADLTSLNRSQFSSVLTELHQTFQEKNLGATFDDDNSYTDSAPVSVEKTYRKISPEPQYTVDLVMGHICEETIKKALRSLRPVPCSKYSPNPTPSQSPPSSPRTSTYPITEDPQYDTSRCNDAKEQKRSAEEYLQTVDVEDFTNDGQKNNTQDTTTPCPENIFGWQTESYLNGGRLKFWKKETKPSKDVNGQGSTEINKDKKKSAAWRSLCCL